jgi:hypothetical protein
MPVDIISKLKSEKFKNPSSQKYHPIKRFHKNRSLIKINKELIMQKNLMAMVQKC